MKRLTIHFIYRADISNQGDSNCTPYLYFKRRFDEYECTFHDINQVRYDAIMKDDIVILGGGGLIDNCDEWNKSINTILDITDSVIFWGVGKNSHSNKKISCTIKFEKIMMLSTRDWIADKLKDEYVPCVSCMSSFFDDKHVTVQKIGVLEHVNFPILGFNYPRINNSINISLILEFISRFEVIITNSYHGWYWATLMGKKVILYETFSDKFLYLKYPPKIYSGQIKDDIECANIYPEALEESRNCTLNYAEKVFTFIESKEKKQRSISYYIEDKIEKILNEIGDSSLLIWGAGIHTQMLKPFLQNCQNLIGITGKDDKIPHDDKFIKIKELGKYRIQYILISSYKYRKEMKREIELLNLNATIIDIYERFKEDGIIIDREFYRYRDTRWEDD